MVVEKNREKVRKRKWEKTKGTKGGEKCKDRKKGKEKKMSEGERKMAFD